MGNCSAVTGRLIVGMTGGFGLGMLATANTSPQRQQAAGNYKIVTSLPKIQGQIAMGIIKNKMDLLTHKVWWTKWRTRTEQMNGQPPQGEGPQGGQGQDGFGGDQAVCHRKMAKTVDQDKEIWMANHHKNGGLKVNKTSNKMVNRVKSPPRNPLRKIV